ncbi:MAG: NTP transferase domain-containing protein [Desulfovibrio sp.]|jgi:spore coat polysaccharide biosynthesis protein SpsF|nr:NTP transferase domain-containing protein [Desulfovibrio sp.]
MNIVAIIQARMGSSRLPCKAMLCLHGLPVIDWVVHRTAKSELLNDIVVAIPETSLDDVLARHLENQGVAVFRGPEQDVLRRFVLAAEQAEATHVVRVCADNPAVWGPEIDRLIRHFLALPSQDNAYAYNHIPKNNSYADGLGAEMLSFALLKRLDLEASLPEHREHCLSYIHDNPELFRISTFEPPDERLRRPDVRLDMDSPRDYRKLALMPINADMHPAEIVLRCPKQEV